MSSRVDPLHVPRTTGFQTALGIAEILTDLNRQVSSPCAPSASIASQTAYDLVPDQAERS